ncbi:hypothetical protein F5Y19DRAFT_490773 [Xylariaceae sp. FL1651]|nr:hypothetical protein F5Y19DRAFT_490773 [Xylariaceae sp. FL1651]
MSHESKGARNRLEPPAITATAKEPVTTQFVLGVDTCGFTTSSTITCDFGYQCTNVDTYRGCCVAGAADCNSTIYTSCLNYENMPNAAMCGPHTLCCPLTRAYCFSYAFTTADRVGVTFTHVRCAESPGFGELYPYPLDWSTTTEDSSTASNTSNILNVEPVDDNSPASSNHISAGAITGAVVGGIIFVLLAISGLFLFFSCRRRQREERIQDTSADDSAKGKSKKDTHLGDRVLAGCLRPLSAIHEQRSPLPVSPSPRDKGHSATTATRPQSFGPNWPLGPGGSMSPANPLALHPIANVEKRLSLHDFSSQPQPHHQTQIRVPILQVPTPPPPGTRLAPPPPPPPPPKKKPVSPRTSMGSSPTSASSPALQSPRLTYVPAPPIDAAFGEEVEKRLSGVGVGVPTKNTTTGNATISLTSPLFAAAMSSLESLDTEVVTARRITIVGSYGNASRRGSSPEDDYEPVSPVSPLDDDDDAPGNQRMSLVSAPSAPGNMDQELDDLVSPVSPHDTGSAEGRVSPVTVSPLESRRGSIGQ